MEGRRNRSSNLNNLVERSNSYSNIEPYFFKKTSVMILLAKILYGVITLVLIGFGVYFLYMSKQEFLSKDVIDFNRRSLEWNQTARSDFEDWQIVIKNENGKSLTLENEEKKMHQYDDTDQIYYNPLQKVSKEMTQLISNLKLTKKKSYASSYSYNLTANFQLEIINNGKNKTLHMDNVDLFIRAPAFKMKQSECVKNKGLWNYEDESCYKYYMLRSLCIILDQQTQEYYFDYKHFKCNGFNDWYESFSVFPWMVPTYDPSYDDLEALNKKIGVYVSTNKDPYVWANYNGTLHFSNVAESYSVAGVWLITCAIALIIIPLLVYFKDKSYLNQQVEEEKEDRADSFTLNMDTGASNNKINPASRY